jgi:two-component sensor histidine kinase
MRIGDIEVLGLTLRQLIGGRWAVSWVLYLINLPLNFLGMSSHIVDARSADVLPWVIVWAIGYVAFGVILLAANLTVLRNRRSTPVAVGVVVAVGAIAGGFRGLTVGIGADVAGISGGDLSLIAVRMITGTALGMALVPLGALFLALINEYSRQRSALIGELTTLETTRMRDVGASDLLRQTLVDQLAVKISTDSDSFRAASHEVWPADSPRERVRWGNVVATSLLHNPFPGTAVAVVWSVSALLTLTAAIGPVRATLQVAASALAIWWIFRLARQLMPSGRLTGLLWFVVVMLATVIVTGPVASLIFDPRPIGSGTALIVANAFWLPLFTILISICIGAVRSGESVLLNLQAMVREDDIAARAAAQEMIRLKREVAESLHSVQSRVYAARAQGSDQVILADLLSDPDASRSPEEILQSVITPWASLIDIQFQLPPDPLSLAQARSVKRVMQEGLANAYRHGGSSTCSILIAREGAALVVEITDNGDGQGKQLKPGLGSAILDEVTGGAWTLRNLPEDKGCSLVARINR